MPSIIGLIPQIGPMELIIILVIVVLILGPKRIPAAIKSVGQGVRGFRDTVGSGKDEEEDDPVVAEKSESREKSQTGS